MLDGETLRIGCNGPIPMRFLAVLHRFARAQCGATATEYALLIALISFLSVAAWMGIGDGLKNIFEYITAVLV
jgi:Flp pilus assembly pilin Flp